MLAVQYNVYMSLPHSFGQSTLFDIQNLLGQQFAADDRYRIFCEVVYPRLAAVRPVLQACYCLDNGRPGVEPVTLLGISVLQFMERLPDRSAIEMVRYHSGWRLALRLDLGLTAPDPSTLCNFRQRLLAHEQAKIAFDAVLAGLQEMGLVRQRGRQRLDSTHVLGAVARLSSLECVRQATRLALTELKQIPGLRLPEFFEGLWERYVDNKLDYGLEEAALERKYQQTGVDVLALLTWVGQQEPAVREGANVKLLERVFGEHFEVVEGSAQKRRRPAGSVQNPHDPDAQWSSKGKTGKAGWVGYKAQVSETAAAEAVKDGEPTVGFITAIETQEATGSEVAGMQQVLDAQEKSGLERPAELYVDAGYVSAETMKQAQDAGGELVGPALGSSHQAEGFKTEDFQVDVENRQAVCPEGKLNSGCTRAVDAQTGKATFRFEWGGQCQQCPRRGSCFKSGSGGRTLEVGEHHQYLQERRREQKTPEFQERMKRRNGIEGTISELVRGHGLRRSRYRGLPKTQMCNYFIGAACNVKRLIRRVAHGIGQGVHCALEAAKTAAALPSAAFADD